MPTLDESVFALRRRLYSYIRNGVLGESVGQTLLPKGEPLLYEKPLWDYKLTLPKVPQNIKTSQILLAEYNAAIAETVKDVVSFYNSYGGYIVVGVRDKPRQIEGFNAHFDVDDLNKRVKSATGHSVDCHFTLSTANMQDKSFTIGILFVPQRCDSELPAVFRKDAPENPHGIRAYRKGDYYLRQGDECRPAMDPDDYSFLCTPGRRSFHEAHEIPRQNVSDNNLGPRDPGLIRFVGRESYLQNLWQWLLEKYSPCKLLAGLGGVGKTTIARRFAETVALESPLGFERVIWLSAKPRYWRSFNSQLEDADPNDIRYYDTQSLLRSLLSELGYLESEIDADTDLTELIEQTLEALRVIPAFVVIDDIDSLDSSEQQTAFQTAVQVFGQTIGRGTAPSKALLTARLDLGAAPNQLLRVRGLETNEFEEYLESVINEFEIDSALLLNKSLLKRFHKATDGSPIFANSVLRLVSYGEKLETAIEKWRGADGEDVRRFAFEREIEFLSDSQLRTLLALTELKQSSLVELQHVLEINRTHLRDNISALRKYHLVVRDEEAPAGGPDISVPNSIRLMQSVVEQHVSDFQRIKKRCKDSRTGISANKLDVGLIIIRVVNLWRGGEIGEALEVAEWAHKRDSSQPDLCCLLGRAHLQMGNERSFATKADAAFRIAQSNGCKRAELFKHWLEAKQVLGDWHGIIEVTELADRRDPVPDNVFLRAFAYQELGEEAKNRGEPRAAADYYLKGGTEIDSAFKKGYAKGRVNQLIDLKTALLREYIITSDSIFQNSNDYLYTWFACYKTFELHVRYQPVISLGLIRLKEWWSAVERRERHDEKAPETLKVQLRNMNNMLNELHRLRRDHEEIFGEILETRDFLEERMERYVEIH